MEVFADYAAAATRYGMHGTKQVLPATEFGRCLQQVFPQTAARFVSNKYKFAAAVKPCCTADSVFHAL